MRVVVTRPGEDGAALAEILGARGIESVLEPLLTIKQHDGAPVDLEGIQAMLVTSANGVRALARRTDNRSIPIFAVGDATATTARSSGFSRVHSASGDVTALVELVNDLLKPKDGPLLHVAGSEIAGDLAAMVVAAGFECRREMLYEAEKARTMSASLTAAIKDNQIDAVLLYSPRSAETFVQLLRKARIVRYCRSMNAVCLSQAVADKVNDLGWKDILIAAHPSQDALLEALDDITGTKNGGDANSSFEAIADEGSASRENIDTSAHTIAPIQRRRGGAVRTVFLTLFVVVILFGIGAATKPLWRIYLAAYLPEDFLTSSVEQKTATRLEEMSGRLSNLERKSSTKVVPDFKTLLSERDRLRKQLTVTLGRLDKLENSIDAVKKMINALNTESGTGAEEMLRRLSERLKKLEVQNADLEKRTTDQGESKESVKTKALLLAVGQLRDAARSGHPYRDELLSVQLIAQIQREAEDPESKRISDHLDQLAKAANTGTPNLSGLKADFKSLAGTIVKAAMTPAEGGWVQRTLARLTQSVKWRQTDNLEGPGIEAVVARAEQAVRVGNLAKAIKELSVLKNRPAKIAAPWINGAELHLNVQKALSGLQSLAVSKLAAGG